MKIYELVINATPVLITFSPVEIVERLIKETADKEIPILINVSEVK